MYNYLVKSMLLFVKNGKSLEASQQAVAALNCTVGTIITLVTDDSSHHPNSNEFFKNNKDYRFYYLPNPELGSLRVWYVRKPKEDGKTNRYYLMINVKQCPFLCLMLVASLIRCGCNYFF